MKNNKHLPRINSQYRFLLLFGLICILLGIIFQICLFNSTFFNSIVIQSAIIAFLAAFLLFLGFVHANKFRFYYPGLILAQTSIFWLIVNNSLNSFTFLQLWPILLMISGESMVFATILARKRLRFSVLVPSFSFILLGIAFLLFSLDIIKISFIAFATTWWPIMLILAGVVLLVIFFYKQADTQNTEAVINDNEKT